VYPIQMLTFTKFSTTMIVVAGILAGCSPDDPIETLAPESELAEAPIVVPDESPVMETTHTYKPPSTSIPDTRYEVTLTESYTWMENSDEVIELQELLGLDADGIYGPVTRNAHVLAIDLISLPTGGVPEAPAGSPRVYTSPAAVEDGQFWPNVERWRPAVTEAVYAWGGGDDDVDRFLRIMTCESAGLPDAKNPNSSASGLMQQLARYWPERAASAGIPGADVFDPYANIYVSAWLALAAPGGGWDHWVCT
jgi:hypothetical protein